MTRALALIDGEHYAPVIKDCLEALPYDFVGAYLLGGTEKLKGGDDYGVAVHDDLEAALDELEPDVVLDLSDEPVLTPRTRFQVASRVLARGIPYEGADFRFDPPALQRFELPSLSIAGLGKRVGKTTVTGYTSRLLSRERDVVIVTMGRGGPAEPRLADERPTVASLLELSRSGAHAASDYLELAAVSGAITIGCRRCGGGLAGDVAYSNVAAGAALAAARSPDLVVFDGSGAALPPVATDRRMLVAPAHLDAGMLTGYLNRYRILVSDLVLLTMAEEGSDWPALKRAVGEVKGEISVVAAVLRPRPLESIDGERVALFTTAPEPIHERQAAHLREEHGADVVLVSGNLSRRDALREDLERADADVLLTEIKGAAIDVVAETGDRRGTKVVFCDNDLLPLPGEPNLDRELEALAEEAVAARAAAR